MGSIKLNDVKKIIIIELDNSQINSYRIAIEHILKTNPNESLGDNWYLNIELDLLKLYSVSTDSVTISYEPDIANDILRLFKKTYSNYSFASFEDIISFLNNT